MPSSVKKSSPVECNFFERRSPLLFTFLRSYKNGQSKDDPQVCAGEAANVPKRLKTQEKCRRQQRRPKKTTRGPDYPRNVSVGLLIFIWI